MTIPNKPRGIPGAFGTRNVFLSGVQTWATVGYWLTLPPKKVSSFLIWHDMHKKKPLTNQAKASKEKLTEKKHQTSSNRRWRFELREELGWTQKKRVNWACKCKAVRMCDPMQRTNASCLTSLCLSFADWGNNQKHEQYVMMYANNFFRRTSSF